MLRVRELLDAVDASGREKVQRELWRARLLDPDELFFDRFVQPPEVLYKYVPAVRLDDVLPEGSECRFRATPPNELNDINEVNFRAKFVEDETNRERINRDFAETLTKLLPSSPVSVDDVESYREEHRGGYGAALACDQLSRRYGVTAFAANKHDVQMWSHYADDCRGVVIGYSVNRWVRPLVGTSIIRQVVYSDEVPAIAGPGVVNQGNAYSFMSRKGAGWAYEQEWRLITELSKAQPAGKDVAVVTVPQSSVSSVVVTDRTSQNVVATIARRLTDPSNNYRVRQIDRLQRGRDAARLASVGLIRLGI